jgi:hypothetical protein
MRSLPTVFGENVSYEVSGVSDAKILLFSEKNRRALLFVGDVRDSTSLAHNITLAYIH